MPSLQVLGDVSDVAEKPLKKEKKSKKEKKDKTDKKDKKLKSHKRRRTSDDDDSAGSPAKKGKKSKIVGCDPAPNESNGDVDGVVNGVGNGDVEPAFIERFRLSGGVKTLLKKKGIEALFPIQAQTLDFALDGFDVVGRARTGSGKTLAFVLPVVEKLMADLGSGLRAPGRSPSVVVLAPTRELAKQVAAEFEYIGAAASLKTSCIYGGTPYRPQEEALRRGIDTVVGTPGRVKDHLERGTLDLTKLRFQILDECDEMLNMGFVDDVELILNAVGDRSNVQTLLFSATLPPWVKNVTKRFLKSTHKVVDLVGSQKLKASSTVKHLALYCHWSQKAGIVSDLVKFYGAGGRSIVFTETKSECDEMARELGTSLRARAIHGDIAQAQREFTLAGFRQGKFSVLTATDVAARGLDITGVDLVIQATLSKDSETYIHRSGRTGRAGRDGISISLVDRKREELVPMIEMKAGVKFERIGAPQPKDMAKLSGQRVVEKMGEVGEIGISSFKACAEAAAKDFDSPLDALAAAIACLAGHSESGTRSLLTGHKDLTTLTFTNKDPIRSPGFVFSVLHRVIQNEEVVNAIQGMTLTADGYSAVFEVRRQDVDTYVNAMAKESANGNRGNVSLTVPDCLPELRKKEARGPASGGPGGHWGGMSNRKYSHGVNNGSFPKGSFGTRRGSFGGRGRSFGGGRGGGRV